MDLKDIFSNKVIALLYPQSIISRVKYKKEIDFNKLVQNQQVYLLRRSLLMLDKTFVSNGSGGYELNEDALVAKTQGVVNLSMNIFGSYFKENFLKYRISHKLYGGMKWNNMKVYFLKNLSSISLNNKGCPIYIDANKIHNKPRKVKKPATNDILQDFITKTGLNPVLINTNGSKQLEFQGNTAIKHDPLNFNYWHAEYQFFDYNNKEPLRNLGSKWGEQFCQDVITNTLSINCYPKPYKGNYKLSKSIHLKF